MSFIHDYLRRRLLRNLGLVDQHYGSDMREIVESQWSERFEQLRLNRMAISYFRYGIIRRPVTKEIPAYDHVGYVRQLLKRYLKEGNQEYLLDAANLLMIEFERPCCHPSPHLTPTDGRSFEADEK